MTWFRENGIFFRSCCFTFISKMLSESEFLSEKKHFLVILWIQHIASKKEFCSRSKQLSSSTSASNPETFVTTVATFSHTTLSKNQFAHIRTHSVEGFKTARHQSNPVSACQLNTLFLTCSVQYNSYHVTTFPGSLRSSGVVMLLTYGI